MGEVNDIRNALLSDVPLEEQVRYGLLISLVRGPYTAREAAARIGRKPRQLRRLIFGSQSPTMRTLAEWIYACGFRPQVAITPRRRPSPEPDHD